MKNTPATANRQTGMGVLAAASIGVGGMVGGGIFEFIYPRLTGRTLSLQLSRGG